MGRIEKSDVSSLNNNYESSVAQRFEEKWRHRLEGDVEQLQLNWGENGLGQLPGHHYHRHHCHRHHQHHHHHHHHWCMNIENEHIHHQWYLSIFEANWWKGAIIPGKVEIWRRKTLNESVRKYKENFLCLAWSSHNKEKNRQRWEFAELVFEDSDQYRQSLEHDDEVDGVDDVDDYNDDDISQWLMQVWQK